jgi:hypothetical protein
MIESGQFFTQNGNVDANGETDFAGGIGPDGETQRYNRDARSICAVPRSGPPGYFCLIRRNRIGPSFRVTSFIRDIRGDGPAAHDIVHARGGPLAFMGTNGVPSGTVFRRAGSVYGHSPVQVGPYSGPSGNRLYLRVPGWVGRELLPTVSLGLRVDGSTVDYEDLPVDTWYPEIGALWLTHPLTTFGPHAYERVVVRFGTSGSGASTTTDVTGDLALTLGGLGYVVNEDEGLTLGRVPSSALE